VRWPDIIENDLLEHKNIDIGLWHSLAINPLTGGPYLSSRRLLILLEHMPEESEFKRVAERGGRWSIKNQMQAESVNEQYRMRASYHAAHSTDDNDVRFDPTDYEFVDPVVARARAEQEAAEAEISAQTEPELADAGWM
jgi:hypothetical protein